MAQNKQDNNQSNNEGAERHFRTDQLLPDLKGRAISSGFITTAAQAIKLVLTIASTAIMARLLDPQPFGLISMVMAVTGFVRIFKDFGLSIATVQREGITHAQVSNLFWINVGVSGLTGLVVAACAPLIAWFYHEPQLIPITLVFSLTFILTGSTVQHTALLNRQMRFKAIAFIDISSSIISVVVGIVLAWQHFGVWSLVAYQVSLPLTALILTWSASRWRPQMPRKNSGTRSLLNFGFDVTASFFIYSVARGSDVLMIGRWYGAGPLGLYSRAAALIMRPLEQFLSPIDAVAVPALSRLQNEPQRYRVAFIQTYESVALLSSLFSCLFLPLAHPLTVVLLGEKWDNAAPIFAGFTVAAIFQPLAAASSWLFASQGRGKDWLKTSSINSALTVCAFVAGLPFGPQGVAIAYSIYGVFVELPVFFYLAGRSGPVGTRDLYFGFLRYLPVCAVVGGTSFLSHRLLAGLPPFAHLVICALIGLLVGGIFIYFYTPARSTALSIYDLIREFLRSRQLIAAGKANQAREMLESATIAQSAQDQAAASLNLPIQFSVVIPTYNRRQLVERAIESVLKQTVPVAQIIVVDDGSTDDTPQIEAKYGQKIQYVRQKNAGVSAARNRGIELAVQPWTAFLDSDDHWSSTHLEKISDAVVNTAGNASLYFANTGFDSESANKTLWGRIGFQFNDLHQLNPDGTDWMLSRSQPCTIQASVFKTAVLKSLGGFNVRYRVMEDTDLFCKVGIGSPICAVNSVGCILTSDDDPRTRLTGIYHIYSREFWEHESALWRELLARFPDLPKPQDRAIRYCLAVSYWRQARLHWRARRFWLSFKNIVLSAKAEPAFLIWLLRYRQSFGWETKVLPPCRAK